jgi:hypothetical protein
MNNPPLMNLAVLSDASKAWSRAIKTAIIQIKPPIHAAIKRLIRESIFGKDLVKPMEYPEITMNKYEKRDRGKKTK